jgi:hypothetical protein
MRAMLWLAQALLLLNARASAEESAGAAARPRVALLFATRGPMPLEGIWTTFIAGVRGIAPPELSEAEHAKLLEVEAIDDLRERMAAAGQYTASDRLSNVECMANIMYQVCVPS